MFKSIQTKIMFYLLVLSIGMLVMIGFVIATFAENSSHEREKAALTERGELIYAILENGQRMYDSPEDCYRYLKGLPNISEAVKENTFLIKKDKRTVGYIGSEKPYDLEFTGKKSYQNIYKEGRFFIAEVVSLEEIPQLTGWYMCTEESYETAFASVNNLKTGIVLIISVLLFILWPLSRKITKQVTEPTRSLARSLRKAANGDIGREIKTENNDELAHIAESFNMILNNLKSTMQQVLVKSGEAASMKEIMEYIEAAYDNLSAGIISINNIGEVTIYNKEAELLTGIESEKILGLDIKNPIPKELKPLLSALSRCLAKGSLKLKTITDIYNVKGEKIPIIYSINMQFGMKNEVIGAICVFRRIEDIERFQNSANRSKSLEALGEMAADIAHEIKNPLTSIRGCAQLIKIDFSEQNVNLEELEIIIHEVDRLTGMLDRFLKFARPKNPALEETDIKSLILYVLTLMKPEIPRNIEVITEFGDVPLVMVDSELFEPVILNLILNAIQAMPNGGNINITTSYSEKRRMVCIEIRDDGVGIPRDISEKIFQPFFTTKHNGTGLGLAIAFRTVEAHKGIMEVESIVGQMTKFTILLHSAEQYAEYMREDV